MLANAGAAAEWNGEGDKGAPALHLEVVSRVGCRWCDRLKAYLSAQDPRLVQWSQSAVLDPAAQDYPAMRARLLDRAAGAESRSFAQSTFPFVFDARTGKLVGGHDATVALVEATKTVAHLDEDGEREF